MALIFVGNNDNLPDDGQDHDAPRDRTDSEYNLLAAGGVPADVSVPLAVFFSLQRYFVTGPPRGW